MSAAPIEVRGLVKRYGELTAVAGVDLTVEVGDVYGYLGPNGAGKTTSLRMMLGLIRPTEGSVRLFGRDPMQSVSALKGVAGFVEAPTFYPYLSGRRNLELLAAHLGDPRLRPAHRHRPIVVGRLEPVDGARAAFQIGDLAFVHDPPGAHDRNPVAHLLDLGQQVTREQNGHPLVREPPDQHPHVAHACRVESGGRLVEQQQLRIA